MLGAEGREIGARQVSGALPPLFRHTEQPTWYEEGSQPGDAEAWAGSALPLPGPGQRLSPALAAAGGAAGFLVTPEMA